MDKRTIIIGDVHGAFRALVQVIERVNYRPGIDTLVFVGDYVDGYPESFEVCAYIDDLYILSRLAEGEGSVIAIRGNHDQWCLDALEKDLELLPQTEVIMRKHYSWYTQGGEATYKSMMNYPQNRIEGMRDFLRRTKLYHIDKERNILYVHGGFSDTMTFEYIEKNKPFEFMWDRELFYRSQQLQNLMDRSQDRPSEEKLKLGGFDRIYLGHTATNWHEPKLTANVVNVDQNAGWGGKLTAYIHETDTFIQSDYVRDLYPEVAKIR